MRLECLVCGSYDICLETCREVGGYVPTCQECGERHHLRLAGERRPALGYRVRLLKRYQVEERWEDHVSPLTGRSEFSVCKTAERRGLALAVADRDIMSMVVKRVTAKEERTVRWYDRAGDRMVRVPAREETS